MQTWPSDSIAHCVQCNDDFSLNEREYEFEKHGRLFFCCSTCAQSWCHEKAKKQYTTQNKIFDS